MKITYRIVDVFPDDHQIIVRYFTDKVSEESLGGIGPNGQHQSGRTDYALQLPIPTPEGEALEEIIQRAAPVSFFEMKEKISDPDIDTKMSHIKVGHTKSFTPGKK